MSEPYAEPMTDRNSPFRQDELDRAVTQLADVGMTLGQAQEQLWRVWVKGGVPPLAWASAVAALCARDDAGAWAP